MIAELLPPRAAVAVAGADDWDADLIGSEADAVADAVVARQREFRAGRACARRALGRLGLPPVAIPSGERREPIWPDGVRGSITHSDGFCAAAVAREDVVASLGIDAAANRPMPAPIARRIVTVGDRLEGLGGAVDHAVEHDVNHAVDPVALVFSAKEAFYKAWYPLTGRWLDFEDVAVRAWGRPGEVGRLGFEVGAAHPTGRDLAPFQGRWAADADRIVTVVWS
jgi:4'-phosphopantetheinyl transferase EntD